jgi:EAL domain-containing protein (putative c-di-GMP-specific phosphodiesterase class I)
MRIGLSVGVAVYPDHGDMETTLANADAALYRAKAEGGGAVCPFDSGLDSRLRARNALVQDLGKALERGELSLHYQPQADARGEIFGFEALLRWRHPQRGFVSPAEFIPIAEERGLIGALGEWVLREACREASTWPRPLSVAVNLSPVQFLKDDLAGLVHAVLLETGLSAQRLELEITEGVLVGDFARVTAILRRLKAFGARVALDDFGVGYSSLAYLQAFPLDKIKIDRSFVANLLENVNSQAIVRAIVGLGAGLRVPLIAEGVETEGQLAFLRAAGCGEAQGFLIGAPQPIEAYAELVGRDAARRLKARAGSAA